jgi:hypothetical protein
MRIEKTVIKPETKNKPGENSIKYAIMSAYVK